MSASKGQCTENTSAEEQYSDGRTSQFYKAKLVELAQCHSQLLLLVGDAASNGDNAGTLSSVSATSNKYGCTIQAQVGSFSQLISECPEVFQGVPELASWPEESTVSSNDSTRSLKGCNGSDSGHGSSSSKRQATQTVVRAVPINKPKVNVRVGVGVIVKDPSSRHIFAGKRKGSHGSGSLALPGGHLEMYETWEECAIREVEEEMGVRIHNCKYLHATNDPMSSEGKHYVTIFMTAEPTDPTAIPINCEPEKCDGWDSFSLAELQELNTERIAGAGLRLFGPLKQFLSEKPELLAAFLESSN